VKGAEWSLRNGVTGAALDQRRKHVELRVVQDRGDIGVQYFAEL